MKPCPAFSSAKRPFHVSSTVRHEIVGGGTLSTAETGPQSKTILVLQTNHTAIARGFDIRRTKCHPEVLLSLLMVDGVALGDKMQTAIYIAHPHVSMDILKQFLGLSCVGIQPMHQTGSNKGVRVDDKVEAFSVHICSRKNNRKKEDQFVHSKDVSSNDLQRTQKKN